jgi:Domain of unknown function (DUF4384)
MHTHPSLRILALAALLALASFAFAGPAHARRLNVDVWTDRGDDGVYQPGEAMRVKVRTTQDAYLLVYEIDADGAVNLLWPLQRGQQRVEGERTLRLPSEASGLELVVEQSTGQGFLVAVASDRPFRDLPWFLRPYDPQAASLGYDRREDATETRAEDEGVDDEGRVLGDPYVAMERIRRRVLDRPADESAFASDYASYFVHEPVRYPRYLCNDCHRPGAWAWWDGFDPYYARCSVVDFRVNWSWGWGGPYWSSYVPYYYYVVRSDCPPRYQPWYEDHSRFSSWDGWNRWGDLWGGQLRRYKPTPAPVGYTPPPAPGTVWRQGQTPPGFIPPDARPTPGGNGGGGSGWLTRDRGDGRPVWREGPRRRPDGSDGASGSGRGNGGGGGVTPERERVEPQWREWTRGHGKPTPEGVTPGGGSSGSGGSGGSGGARESRPWWKRVVTPPAPASPPRNDPPSSDPPAPAPQNPPSQNPPPAWRQPPPPSSDPPRFTPPRSKPEPGKGKGGRE